MVPPSGETIMAAALVSLMLYECRLSTQDMDPGNFLCARQCGGQPNDVPCSLSQVCNDACCIVVSGEALRCYIEYYDMVVDSWCVCVCMRDRTMQNSV